ncbi:MAG: hypothetical protein N4A33_13165 [Bacteriovoracaceae bacterium]|nr:hypothetical protein [Bacteriovoracaceae bacterium]
MKSTLSDLEQRYILIFKIDAMNLYNRISMRKEEYIEAFSLKRNRAVFKEVFENRYQKADAKDLSHCPMEVIEVLNEFYTHIDDLYWYLKTTQDMPNTIEDEVSRKVTKIGKLYETVALFIDAYLSGKNISEFEQVQPSDIHDLEFTTHGEKTLVEKTTDFIVDEEFADLLEDDIK